MRKALYINIGNRAELKLDPSENGFDLLDITNSIQNVEDKIHLNDLDDYQELVDQALNSYLEFTDQLASNVELNKFSIGDFPLYWLTSVSEKHPIYHWGKSLFLGLEFLIQKKDHIEREYSTVYLSISPELGCFENAISSHFNRIYGSSIELIFDAEGPSRPAFSWWTLFKQIVSYYRSIASSPSVEGGFKRDVFFGRYSKEDEPDQLYNSLNQLFEEENVQLARVPNEFTKAHPFPSFFKKYAPSLVQYLLLFLNIIRKYYRVKKQVFSGKKIALKSGMELPLDFLLDEYREALTRNSHILIYSIWFKRFFEDQSAALRIYFDDEFYKIGRLISHAARQFDQVETFGVQHGNFDRLHTVYSITEQEILSGIPIPDHFITWGELYSSSFLKSNKLDKSYVLALGNPTYINNYKNLSTKKGESGSILWCLTTLECFEIEWKMIHSLIKEQKLSLNIRLHPVGHVSESHIQTTIGNKVQYSISEEKSIRDAILKNELIVVSAHSTVFIDALASNRKCIRLLSRHYDGFSKIGSSTLRTAGNPKDFNDAYEELVNLVESENDLNELLVLEKGHWKEFIAQ